VGVGKFVVLGVREVSDFGVVFVKGERPGDETVGFVELQSESFVGVAGVGYINVALVYECEMEPAAVFVVAAAVDVGVAVA
jgi:hypothetical protein